MEENAHSYYDKHNSAFADDFRLRIYRSLSWLKQADKFNNYENKGTQGSAYLNLDTQFMYLWIGFNAAYARDFGYNTTGDKENFRHYISQLCQLDKQKRIYQLIWQSYTGSIRIILDNQYVFQPFWDYHNQKITEKAWQADFDKAKQKAHRGLQKQDTEQILRILFNRFYTLRNQIFHGGATFASQVNRDQLKDACNIMHSLLPAMLLIMQENHQRDWGTPFYPVVP